MNVLIHSVPVIQSADLLKKAIDEIVGSIEFDQFEHAADLGYEDLSSNFIWMQRALGSSPCSRQNSATDKPLACCCRTHSRRSTHFD